MTRSAILHQQFVGEGHYDLGLRIGELISLQEKLGCGPYVAANRLLHGDWLVEDVTETIRLGLVGGGMSQQDAYNLVRRNVREGYLFDYVALAGRLLMAALSGVDDEPMEDLPGEPVAPIPTPWAE